MVLYPSTTGWSDNHSGVLCSIPHHPLVITDDWRRITRSLLSIKIIAHCCHSVKWLKTRSLGRTVCFADQVTQTSDIPSIPSTPDYVPVHDCPHCCKFESASWRIRTRLVPAEGTLPCLIKTLAEKLTCSLYRIFCTSLSIRLCYLSKASSWALLANMVESSGIEPPTTKLKASCSANWATIPIKFKEHRLEALQLALSQHYLLLIVGTCWTLLPF